MLDVNVIESGEREIRKSVLAKSQMKISREVRRGHRWAEEQGCSHFVRLLLFCLPARWWVLEEQKVGITAFQTDEPITVPSSSLRPGSTGALVWICGFFLSLMITTFSDGWSPGWLNKLPAMSPLLRVPSCVTNKFSSSQTNSHHHRHQLHNPAPIFQPTEKQSMSSWLTPVTNVTCRNSQITQLPLPHWLTALLPCLWWADQATSYVCYVWSKDCASTFSLTWRHARGGTWETSQRPPCSSLTAFAQSPWGKAQGTTRLSALLLFWFTIHTMPQWARFCP